MNFSDFIAQTSGIVKYSPNGDLVAIAKTFEVKIYETNSLRPMHAYSFVDVISHLEWSHDSALILIGISKRAVAFVKSLHDPEWQCKIDEGLAGLAYCQWGPNSNQVITVSEFKVRLTVWTLTDKSMQFIRSPKFDDGKGITFSPNRKLVAIAEKNLDGAAAGKDSIGIYDASKGEKWECLYHLSPDTFDLEDVQFSGDGQHLIVWDSNLKCKLLVYQLQFSGAANISGTSVAAKFTPYENTGLGIRKVLITPNKQYIVCGYFDQKVRVYNSLSWKEIFTIDLSLTDLVDENTPRDLNVYNEVTENTGGSVYEVLNKPFRVPQLQAHQLSKKDDLPRVGVSLLAVSSDNRYVACKNELCPTLVWIYDTQRLQLHTVMVQKQEVEHLEWCPKTPTLNVSTGNGKLYLWTAKVASVCQVPVNKENFSVLNVSWNPNGRSFAALDKNGLVFVYPQIHFKTFLRGFMPVEYTSRAVYPHQQRSKLFIWRNSVTDNYKICTGFQQEPLDLSNFLFIRVRERQLLLNKLNATSMTVTSGLRFTTIATQESLKKAEAEIAVNLDLLNRILYINPEAAKLPVAFATNSLYVLERTGAGNRETYAKVLLPVIKEKGEYLHAEGVSQAVWALSNAGIYDKDVWEVLKQSVLSKNFDYEYVINERWSTGNFVTQSGSEHFLQSELNSFANQLYFQGKLAFNNIYRQINLFELYNGLLKARNDQPSLGLDEAVAHLEDRYKNLLNHNDQYLRLDKSASAAIQVHTV